MQPVFIEITEHDAPDHVAGALLLGVHSATHARLYRRESGQYIIVNPRFDGRRPACIGVLCDNNTGAVIEELAATADARFFHPGAVGPLLLNVPALQRPGNAWSYYIAENQRDAFFAMDFKSPRFARQETAHAE